PRRKARCAFGQTGDRDRFVKSSPRGGKIAATEEGHGFERRAQTGEARSEKGRQEDHQKAVAHAIARCQRSA
ncbi:MAG TPA: hypothetical protein VII74_08935, partial [Chthoniobacterales bacterium]